MVQQGSKCFVSSEFLAVLGWVLAWFADRAFIYLAGQSVVM